MGDDWQQRLNNGLMVPGTGLLAWWVRALNLVDIGILYLIDNNCDM